MRWSMLLSCLVAGGLPAGLPTPAHALDLPTVWRDVAAANPTLAARREMVEAARSRVAPAGAWQSPMVELGAVNVPTSGRFDADPMTMKMVGVTQRVPVFGGNRLSASSARAGVEAETASYQMARYELLGLVWEIYSDAYYADRLAQVALDDQGEMERLVRAAEARYESGNGRLDDVLRARAEQASLRADLAGFQAESRGARARLDALRGKETSEWSDSLAAPPAPFVPDEPAPWLAAVNESIHPRLRELRAEIDRERLAARAARRKAWPDLDVTASYGFREPIGGVAQDNMWSASLGLTLPVFAGGRELSEGAEREAMVRAKEAELRAATLDLRQQVLATHAAAQADVHTVALLADTVVATQRRAVEASWSSYRAGTTDLWRVFEATHALHGEEVALLRARQELARTEARLLSITASGDLLGVSLPATPRSER